MWFSCEGSVYILELGAKFGNLFLYCIRRWTICSKDCSPKKTPQRWHSRSLKRRRQNARGWPLSQPGDGPDSTWGRPGLWKKSTYWATTRLENSTPSTRHDWGLPLQKLWDARLCNCTQMWSVCFYRFLPRTGSRSWLNSSPTRSSTTRSPALLARCITTAEIF